MLEAILDNHEIEDADVESSIETIAREYNKQDGVVSIPQGFIR
jgi:DNA polymerase epsilon subunit 2